MSFESGKQFTEENAESSAEFEITEDEEIDSIPDLLEERERRLDAAKEKNKEKNSIEIDVSKLPQGTLVETVNYALVYVRNIMEHTKDVTDEELQEQKESVGNLMLNVLMYRIMQSGEKEWKKKPVYYRALALEFAELIPKK